MPKIKRHEVRLPKVEAVLRRLDAGGDPFDRLITRLRAKDGPFFHANEAPPSTEEPDPEEGVAPDAVEGVNRPQGGADRQAGAP